jgi:hypothetical protein
MDSTAPVFATVLEREAQVAKKRKISEKKLKDMVRSILPSTARAGARESLANERRRKRRKARRALGTVDDQGYTDCNLKIEPQQNYNVWDRRARDKLNHFMRWCDFHTRGLSAVDAIAKIRGLVPNNLIGEHALGHWEGYCRFSRGNKNRVSSKIQQKRREQSNYDKTGHLLYARLASDPAFHSVLNRALKKSIEAPRLLAGVHDVEAFIRSILVPAPLGDSRPTEKDVFYTALGVPILTPIWH